MVDNGVIERAMVANGYTINNHGGAFCWGVTWPLEDKVRLVLVYLCLKEVNPDSEVLIREVKWLGECSRSERSNGLPNCLGILPKNVYRIYLGLRTS